jgi:hypothetical protein
MHPQLTNKRLQRAREAYAYPPARVVVAGEMEPADILWPGVVRLRCAAFDSAAWKRGEGRDDLTSVALDDFHGRLLGSDSDADILHGIASVQYWGNAWAPNPRGKGGKDNSRLALARTRFLTEGKASGNGHEATPQDRGEIVRHLKAARTYVAAGDLQGALLLGCLKIDHIGFSFATKLVAFLDPTKAAVYDSVIGSYLDRSQDLDHEHLRTSVDYTPTLNIRTHQANAYARWCAYCHSRAGGLNAAGLTWTDWDGRQHDWRAIDVERALYAIATAVPAVQQT